MPEMSCPEVGNYILALTRDVDEVYVKDRDLVNPDIIAASRSVILAREWMRKQGAGYSSHSHDQGSRKRHRSWTGDGVCIVNQHGVTSR